MAKFVVRLIDAQFNVLAWAEVYGVPKAISRARCEFWPKDPTQLVTTETGTATGLAIHWTDYDVANVVPLPAHTDVIPGLVFDFNWAQPVWVLEGQDVPLNAVVVARKIEIGPPTGSLTQATS